jgi:glycosyltransferase involved in cell wall biosynthesis
VKIAHFVSSFLAPLGGAEQYCLELSRWLRDRGHSVTIVTGWISPEVAEQLAGEGIAVRIVRSRRPYAPDRKGSRPAALVFHALDVLGSIRTPVAVRRALSGFDLVHVHRVAGFGTALLASTAAPVVLTVHDYSLVDTSTTLLRRGAEAPRPPLIQRLRTALVNRTVGRAHLVFPNTRLREKHLRWGLRMPERTIVLPHGWRLGGGGAPQSTPAGERGGVVFLFLGKLLDTKGIALLLDAWGDGLAGPSGPAELWIAGSGPMEPAVDAAAAAGRVRKLGWLDDTARRTALAAADVLVIPSIWPENFPLAAAEGVLAGLPILSTTIAAPPVVEPEVNGVLVAPDAAAIRAGMIRLLDPALRSRLADGAGERARDLDFDVHGERVLELYRAVETRRVPRRSSAGGAQA